MFHKLFDKRVNCISIMVEMNLGLYLKMVEAVYKEKGGLKGQRAPLKTKTAILIRKRMVDDIRSGAVLPPVVLGMLASKSDMDSIESCDNTASLIELMEKTGTEKVSIIDGMQRTTAMMEAVESDSMVAKRSIRVEFWISEYLNSLVYRMLVLNTGQVPWEIGRQLETVYAQFLSTIRAALKEDAQIFEIDEQRRRVSASQFQGKTIIELMLLFTSRKTEIDVRDRVAEDFARLDAIESTSHQRFLEYFIETLRMITVLDRAFSTCEADGDALTRLLRIKSGHDIFSSFPAMAGFCTAVAVELFDEPGFAFEWEDVPRKLEALKNNVSSLVEKISLLDAAGRSNFIQLELLEERLSVRSGQVGRFEREFFRSAFKVLLANASRLNSLEPCWKAR